MGTSYLVEDMWREIERLREVVEPAKALIENIVKRGMHDNWKLLAAALRALDGEEG